MELREAIEKAVVFFGNNRMKSTEIGAVYESDQDWIMFPNNEGKTRIGGFGVKINRTDGQESLFVIPSEENFKILDSAKRIH